jgi:O-antigen/teichoic acid export membrane protein
VNFKRTITSAASVVGGEIVLRIASFAGVVVMGRLYGPATLGLYATTLAFATVAVMVGEFGLQISVINEIGRAPGQVSQLFGRLYSLRVSLFLLLLLALSVVGWARQLNAPLWVISSLITVRTMLFSCSQLQFAVLKGLDRMKVIGLMQLLSAVLLGMGIAMTYSFSWSFVTLLWCFIITQSVEIVLTLIFLSSSGIRPVPFSPRGSWALLKASTSAGFTYLIAAIILRADVLILSVVSPRADVGRFAAANVGIVFVYAVAWILGSVLLADQIRLLEFPSEGRFFIRRWRKVLFLAAAPSSLALCWLAPRIVSILYGRGFESTGRLASVMVLAVPFILLNATYLSQAMALGAKRVYLGTYFGTAIVAVCLDLALGRLYGATGVASAIVLREILMFLAFRAFDPRPPVGNPVLESRAVSNQPAVTAAH